MLSRTSLLRRQALSRSLSLARHRPLSTSLQRRAYKDDQDRESLNPKAPYGSQGGGDEATSHNPDSYNPKKTAPETEKAENPQDLDVTGANQDLSKPQGDDAG